MKNQNHKTQKLICVGIVTGPHGIKGGVKIKSFTELPETIGTFETLTDETGSSSYKITIKQIIKDQLIATIAEVDDRNKAETFRGLKLYIYDKDLPSIGEEEFYHSHIVGLRVSLLKGDSFGFVSSVQNFGAGDLLEISDHDKKQFYIPFTKDIVPTIDIAAGYITIDPPAGMLENAE